MFRLNTIRNVLLTISNNNNNCYHRFLNENLIRKCFKHDLKINPKSSITATYKLNNNKLKIHIKNKYIVIEEQVQTNANNLNLKYPQIWLRDNCQCAECFHNGSRSRTINWEQFNVNVQIKDIWVDQNTNDIKCLWTDNHESVHSFEWLKERSFSPANQQNYLKSMYRPTKNLWSKMEFERHLKSFDFQEILRDDQVLLNWLEALAVNGVAMIKNTPSNENECRKVADRVGFIKKTHYGEEFIVRAKGNATSNVAYLSTPLQLHTDLPYYEYKPGVNLLHCLIQSHSPGAFNLLTDGFYVAQRLLREFPKYYEILTKTLVNWSDIGHENYNYFHSIYRAPVISLDRENQMERINYSVPQRDSFFSIPIEQVNDWYEAMATFTKLLYDESVSFKTQPGDILTFDNIRLVHGRTGYTDDNGNTRHVVGAYLDWDEIFSRLRVLKKKQQLI